MKFMDLIVEQTDRRAGREYQHLEDFVYTQGGSPGARQAVEILRRLNKNTSTVAVKFDGHPNIYWGRDSNGKFQLTPKSGWGKMLFSTAQEVGDWFVSKSPDDEWRHAYGQVLADAWNILEQNTPEDFTGFLYGDLLWYPTKPPRNISGQMKFGPGKVQYSVDTSTALGGIIRNSKLGVAVHQQYARYGDTDGKLITGTAELNTNEVVALGQIPVVITPKLDERSLNQIDNLIDEYATDMNGFLTIRKGMSDIAAIVYRYVNYRSKTQQLENLASGFLPWLKTSSVSAGKQSKILDLMNLYPDAILGIFTIFTAVMTMKNQLINQLDSSPKPIDSQVNGQPGGEGYIDQQSKAKLVPRHRWRPVWDE